MKALTPMHRAKELLQEKKLDAVLIASGYNIRYLGGFTGATGYLYISGSKQVILTDARYTTQAKEQSIGCEVVEVHRELPYVKAICGLVEEDNVKSLGFEDQVMLYADAVKLETALKQETKLQEWSALGNAVDRLRLIKTEEEIACIRQAEAIGDEAFSYILGILKPGMTEMEVAVELESFMKKHGAQRLSFDTIAASGTHSAMPHAEPSNKIIQKGDFLTMDFGCIYEGYCSDMTRTVVLGKAEEKQKQIYETVLSAQLAALEYIEAGKTGAQVDAVARDIIKKAGYGDCFGHGLGHSVGLFIHEEPRLSPGDHTVLEPGMTETVEPGIYVPGYGGVRIEDLVVVRENGCENLTHSPKNLIEL